LSLPESQRRETLQALGIDCYLPRVQLPGAPDSSLYTVYTVVTEQVTQVSAPATAPAQADAAQDHRPAPPAPSTRAERVAAKVTEKPAQPELPQAREKTQEKAQEKLPKKAPEQAAADTSRVREEIKLQLVCIRGGGDLAILAAMPHLGPTQLSPRHQALLANLLRGCRLAPGDLAIEEKPFRWPMVTGLHVDNSKRAAAMALKAYLHQKMSDWETRKLLVLGEAVVRRLFESDAETPEPPLPPDWQIAWTRSLDELLQRPVLKKDAWQQIRQQFA